MTTYLRHLVEVTSTNPCILDGFYAVPEDYDLLSENKRFAALRKDDEGADILPESFVYLEDNEDEAKRVLAVCFLLDDFDCHDIRNDRVTVGNREYWVLTDDEADKEWDQQLDNYIDECLEIPESVRNYFDAEKWKNDARIDGRGHSLASYDGNEEYEEIDGETLYIYRTS